MTAVMEPPVGGQSTPARSERLGAAAVYVAGAAAYYVARRYLGLGFTASPLFAGVLMLVASYFRLRLLASAVLLITWGSAILFAGHGPIAAGHSTPLYIGAFGLGALILLLLRRWIDARVALENVASVMLAVGLWFYFDYDYPVMERIWLWSAWLLANAAALVGMELVQSGRLNSSPGPSPR